MRQRAYNTADRFFQPKKWEWQRVRWKIVRRFGRYTPIWKGPYLPGSFYVAERPVKCCIGGSSQ